MVEHFIRAFEYEAPRPETFAHWLPFESERGGCFDRAVLLTIATAFDPIDLICEAWAASARSA